MAAAVWAAVVTASGAIVVGLMANWEKLPFVRGRVQPKSDKEPRPTIEWVQLRLASAGFEVAVDGVLGPDTTRALMLLQRREGLLESGTVDEPTRLALQRAQEAFKPVQSMLRACGFAVQLDGLCGPATIAALRQLQRDHGIAETGVADEETRRALSAEGGRRIR